MEIRSASSDLPFRISQTGGRIVLLVCYSRRHRARVQTYTSSDAELLFTDTLLGNEASDLITKRITWERSLISGNHCRGMHTMLINPSVIHHLRALELFQDEHFPPVLFT